jgi:hypothetical protein
MSGTGRVAVLMMQRLGVLMDETKNTRRHGERVAKSIRFGTQETNDL